VITVAEIRDRPTIAVPEAAELLGISRSQGYAAARTGDLPTLALGRRLVVPVRPLLAMLGEQATDPLAANLGPSEGEAD